MLGFEKFIYIGCSDRGELFCGHKKRVRGVQSIARARSPALGSKDIASGYVEAMNRPNSPAPTAAHMIPSWHGDAAKKRGQPSCAVARRKKWRGRVGREGGRGGRKCE